jgi:tetratricopeptide (TPR) repeat protein
MPRRLSKILVGCTALMVSGCPNIMPERSAREWMVDGRAHSAQMRWEDAIADFTEVLRLEPKCREALIQRAHASLNNGDADQALEDSKAALEIQRNDVDLLSFRANIYRGRGENEEANKLDREINRLQASSPDGLHQRGNREMDRGQYARARTHFESALKMAPHNSRYLNSLAWLEAACPQADLRDGHRAVELASEACELTQWRMPLIIDTLAAAYAETGQFDKAVETQQKATALGDLAPLRLREGLLRRLKVYQEGKPYRFGQ